MKHPTSPWLPLCLTLGLSLTQPLPTLAAGAVSMMEEAVRQRSRGAQSEALRLLRQAVQTSSRTDQQTLARLMLGDFLREASRLEEAREVFQAVIDSEAGTEAKAEASFRLAQLWQQLGQPDKGFATARQLLKNYPNSDYAQLARQFLKSAPKAASAPATTVAATPSTPARKSNRPVPVVEGTSPAAPVKTTPVASRAAEEPIANETPEETAMIEEAPAENARDVLPAPTLPATSASKPARPVPLKTQPAPAPAKDRVITAKPAVKTTPAPDEDPEVAALLKSGRFDVIDPTDAPQPGKKPAPSSTPDDARVTELLGSGDFEVIGAEKPAATHVEAPPADDEEGAPPRRAPGLPPREPEPAPRMTAASKQASASAPTPKPAPTVADPVPAAVDPTLPSDLLVYAPLPLPEQEALATTILDDQNTLQKNPGAPDNDQVLFRLALNTARFGEHLEACRLFDQLLTSHPSSAKVEEAYFEAIRLRAILRAFPSVRTWGATFIRTFPKSGFRFKVERLVAYAAAQGKKPAGAATTPKTGSRPAPTSQAAPAARPAAQPQRKADASFQDPASQALRNDQRYRTARGRLDKGHYALAMADLQGLSTEHPQTPLVWYDLALVQIQGKRITDAEQSLNRLLELQPDNPEARSLMGYLHYNAREYGRAKADYEQAGTTDRAGLTFFDPEFAARRMEKSAKQPKPVSTHKGAQE